MTKPATLTICLWSPKGARLDLDLLGMPVWKRTLSACLGLSARPKIRWIGGNRPTAPDSGLEPMDGSALAAQRGTLLFLPAHLPCLTRRRLMQLLRLKRGEPGRATSGLFLPSGESPLVVATDDPAVKKAVAATSGPAQWPSVFERLSPTRSVPPDDEMIAVSNAKTWSDALRSLRRRKIESLLRSGVLIQDPDSVSIHPEVRVARGSVIRPWVLIEGDSRIGKDCRVGSFCHIVDSDIGAGTTLLDHCYIRDSRIGKSAQIGPFTHFRPESDVGDRARVGNFVELKKARLGHGAKAPHLSYLGDAVIGNNANIGAGTITCNYDGKRKHGTVVGEGAFIGSDVQLVAPVRVGKEAFIAAGSCIVEDVPPRALALARSRQTVKKGWVAKKSRKGTMGTTRRPGAREQG